MNSADSKQLLSKDSPSPGTALCEISELRNEVERHLTGIENAGGVLDLEKLSDLQAEQLQMTD